MRLFDLEYHEWLLGDKVDILPRLLLPLAGPEEFDDDDNNKLPEDLQYLEPEKERESDPDIRCMLVECINKVSQAKLLSKGPFYTENTPRAWPLVCRMCVYIVPSLNFTW